MFRATTPKHVFVFDVEPDTTFKVILISYAQNGTVILEKGKQDLTFEEGKETDEGVVYEAYLRLTQEETNMFVAPIPVTVQIRALTYEDEAVASEKMSVDCKAVLNDEVLT